MGPLLNSLWIVGSRVLLNENTLNCLNVLDVKKSMCFVCKLFYLQNATNKMAWCILSQSVHTEVIVFLWN